MQTVQKVSGLIIKDKRMLVVRRYGEHLFFAPGRDIVRGESKENVLTAELREDLGIATYPADLKQFASYKVDATGRIGAVAEMEVMLVVEYRGQIHAGSKIEEVAWLDSRNQAAIPLDNLLEKYVTPDLVAKGLID